MFKGKDEENYQKAVAARYNVVAESVLKEALEILKFSQTEILSSRVIAGILGPLGNDGVNLSYSQHVFQGILLGVTKASLKNLETFSQFVEDLVSKGLPPHAGTVNGFLKNEIKLNHDAYVLANTTFKTFTETLETPDA